MDLREGREDASWTASPTYNDCVVLMLTRETRVQVALLRRKTVALVGRRRQPVRVPML